MYKVFIEDYYQIVSLESFCRYHRYNFDDTEEDEFLRIFSTEEEAKSFIKETFIDEDFCDEWIPFVVHMENGEVIDIDGKIPQPPIHFKDDLIKYNKMFHTDYEYVPVYVVIFKDGSRKLFLKENIPTTDDVISVSEY